MTLEIKLGKYTLLEEIGRGGYGTVYRALDDALKVERAVKVLHPALVADPTFVERFREEARLVARLKHPHVAPVYDLGEKQGRIFLAMEYLSGGSLKDMLSEDGPMPFERALEVLNQVANALDYAHKENLVHRDVKPGNILFDEKGNAYLTDFGFAKSLASADSSTTMSLTGGVLGTPAYMAPEAWDGEGWTPAADVYSLACVFYEMIMGKALFDGDSPTRLMKQHVIEGARFPEQWPIGVSEGINPIFKKALTRNPDYRFIGIASFINALNEVNKQSLLEEKEETSLQSDKFEQRKKESVFAKINLFKSKSFVIAATTIGFIMIISLLSLIFYSAIYVPKRRAAISTQIIETYAFFTQEAFEKNLTVEAQNWTNTPTATQFIPSDTQTPVILPTDTPAAALAQDERDAQLTATMASLFTQQASNLLTVTPVSTQLPSTSFADDVGMPGLLVLMGAMILIIFLARRLRTTK